jgi:hypothetical protein
VKWGFWPRNLYFNASALACFAILFVPALGCPLLFEFVLEVILVLAPAATPNALEEDRFALAGLPWVGAIGFSLYAFFTPIALGHPDNSIHANPLTTPRVVFFGFVCHPEKHPQQAVRGGRRRPGHLHLASRLAFVTFFRTIWWSWRVQLRVTALSPWVCFRMRQPSTQLSTKEWRV